jgi:hypothetical protein
MSGFSVDVRRAASAVNSVTMKPSHPKGFLPAGELAHRGSRIGQRGQQSAVLARELTRLAGVPLEAATWPRVGVWAASDQVLQEPEK